MNKQCEYSNVQEYPYEPDRSGTEVSEHVKAIKIQCPECKRKIKSMVRYDIHGYFWKHCIPRHKIKKWWKVGKNKKTSRDNCFNR